MSERQAMPDLDVAAGLGLLGCRALSSVWPRHTPLPESLRPLCENARHVPSKGTTLACHLPLPWYWVHSPPAVARTSHW